MTWKQKPFHGMTGKDGTQEVHLSIDVDGIAYAIGFNVFEFHDDEGNPRGLGDAYFLQDCEWKLLRGGKEIIVDATIRAIHMKEYLASGEEIPYMHNLTYTLVTRWAAAPPRLVELVIS